MTLGVTAKEFFTAPTYSTGDVIFAIPGVGVGYAYSVDDFSASATENGKIDVRIVGYDGSLIREIGSHQPLPENHFRTSSYDLSFDAAASASGRFVVVAEEQIYDPDLQNTSPSSAVRFQIHNPDGSLVGGLATIGTGGGQVSNMDVDWLSESRFAIAWVEKYYVTEPIDGSNFDSTYTEKWRVMTAVYDQDGVEIRTPYAVEENVFIRETQRPYDDDYNVERQTGRQIDEPRIVPLSDGGYALLYTEMQFQAFDPYNSPYYQSTLKLQHLDDAGNKAGGAVNLETYPWPYEPMTGTPGSFLAENDFFGMTELDAVQLDNGNLLILYSAIDPDANVSGHTQASDIVYMSVRGLDGATILEKTPVAPYVDGEVGSRLEPRLEKLPDGKVFATFSQTLLNSSQTEAWGVLFDDDGTILMPKFDLSTPGEVPWSVGVNPDVAGFPLAQAAALDNGSIAIAGTVFSGTNLGGIFTFTDEIVGTSAGDTLVGGSFAEKILGLEGVDTLVGGIGNDLLDGGPGADFMFGGRGDDTYYVDDTFDLVDEGYVFPEFGFGGTDTIISSANWFWDVYGIGEIDRIAEDAADPNHAGVTFVGGIFDNTLIGHSGTDILFGRGGNDTYIPGDGIDWISLSTLGLTDQNAYAGVDGHNTIIATPRTSGAISYDIMFEFDPARDKVDVSAYQTGGVHQYASGADVLSRAVDDGVGNSYIALGDGLDYLYFVGITKAQLLASDFVV